MKKKIISGWLVLFWVSVALLLGCASIPMKPLSKDDISDLKGRWEGDRYGASYTHRTEIEIFDENLKGKITFYGTTSGTVDYPFYGKIENGKLVCIWSKDQWVRFSFHKGDVKMELKGDYQWMQWGGTMSLRKVR